MSRGNIENLKEKSCANCGNGQGCLDVFVCGCCGPDLIKWIAIEKDLEDHK